MRELMPHQKLAFEYAKPIARIALFMEMRLGKTLVAIRWAELNKRKRVLVVTPLPVFISWEEELLKEDYAYEDIDVLRGSAEAKYNRASTSNAVWTIVNFESLLESNPDYDPSLKRGRNSKYRIGGRILKLPWDCIIVDESTRIRNPQAEITKHLCNDSNHIGYKGILTGLPDPESPLDYFQQFSFIHGSFLHCPTYWIFRRKYFRNHGYEWVCGGYSTEKIKEEVRKWAFVMTRKKAGIGSRKVYEKRIIEMSPKQKSIYKQVDKGFEYKIGKEEKETKWVPVKYLWMQRIAGGFTPEETHISNNKLNEIKDLLRGELKNEAMVIWFRYDKELKHVSKELRKKGYSVGVFTGADKTGDHLFKSGKVQILCAQERCGQYGLDWSRASTAIYYSNYYDGEVRAQSEDRIVHPKKSEPLLYIDLISEGSIDKHVVDLLKRKKLNAKLFSMELARKMSEDAKQKIHNRSRA